MKPLRNAISLSVFGAMFALGWPLLTAATRDKARTRAASSMPVQPGGGPAMSLEFENESVRAFRIRIAPHEHIPMHDVTPRLVVWLTSARLRDSLATGRIENENHKAGEVTWVPAQRHSGLNLSGVPIEFIAVEPKAAR
jgi:hypothetical protein